MVEEAVLAQEKKKKKKGNHSRGFNLNTIYCETASNDNQDVKLHCLSCWILSIFKFTKLYKLKKNKEFFAH
jgi:hypothetical protein